VIKEFKRDIICTAQKGIWQSKNSRPLFWRKIREWRFGHFICASMRQRFLGCLQSGVFLAISHTTCNGARNLENQTATLTHITIENVLRDAQGKEVQNAKDAVTSTTTMTMTSVTVSTAANTKGQILGGEETTRTATLDLHYPTGDVKETTSDVQLTAAQAVVALGGEKITALQESVAPSLWQSIKDHLITVGVEADWHRLRCRRGMR
jgi:hypothetical protein